MKLSQLPVGARVQTADGSFSCYIASQNHPGYGGTTLLLENIAEILPFDGKEPANPRKRHPNAPALYGNNDFALSNLCQWLNGAGEDWYTPSHPYDAPPVAENIRYGTDSYRGLTGFLDRLPRCIRGALMESKVPTLTGKPENPEITYVTAKVFLPSRTEIGLGGEWGVEEGTMLPLFRDFRAKDARINQDIFDRYASPWEPEMFFSPQSGWRWWLRTPHLKYKYLVRYLSDWGGMSYAPAYSDIVGVRPMMNVGDVEVSDSGLSGNIYLLKEA